MKRITAILITAAALVGGSYVGSVNASEFCEGMGAFAGAAVEARKAGLTLDQVTSDSDAKIPYPQLAYAVRNVTQIVYLTPSEDLDEVPEKIAALCEKHVKRVK